MNLYNMDPEWDQTDEGHAAIYYTDPADIPVSQVARVIYELRLDVQRLNVVEDRGEEYVAHCQVVCRDALVECGWSIGEAWAEAQRRFPFTEVGNG